MNHDMFTKGYAIALYHQKFSSRHISSILKKFLEIEVGKSTLNRWISKYEQEGTLEPQRNNNCGRKQVIGEQTASKMVQEIEKNRDLTAVDLFHDNLLNHNNVSLRSIQRMLNEEGLYARLKCKVPFISDKNQEKRVDWA